LKTAILDAIVQDESTLCNRICIFNKIIKYVAIVTFLVTLFSCSNNEAHFESDYGEEILYIAESDSGYKLLAIDFELTESREILTDELIIGSAKFSPGKDRIAVSYTPPDLLTPPSIYLTDLDGNLIRKITDNGLIPIWSPDGNQIIFARLPYFISVISNLIIIDDHGQNETQLTDSIWRLYTALSWNTITDKILVHEITFWDDSTGTRHSNHGEILLMVNDFSSYENITNNNAADLTANFSPTGDSIAVISGKFNQRDIYIYDLSNNEVINMTNSPAEYRSLCWSPSGKELAFSKSIVKDEYSISGSDIFIINLESGYISSVTNSGINDIINTITDWR